MPRFGRKKPERILITPTNKKKEAHASFFVVPRVGLEPTQPFRAKGF